jgi:hypothetical protein
MRGQEEFAGNLGPHPRPIGGRQRRAHGQAGRRIDHPDAFGHLQPERADITIDNPERNPQTGYLLEVAYGEVRSFQLLLSELGQRMQTAAKQGPHLLRGDRVARPQAVDAVHAGSDPHPWRLTAFGVVGREAGMTFLGRVQGRHLPGQVVIPRPGSELVEAHGHNPRRGIGRHGGHAARGYVPAVHRVCGTSDSEIEWGYVGSLGYTTVNTGGSAQAELSGRLGVGKWSRSSEQPMRPRQVGGGSRSMR